MERSRFANSALLFSLLLIPVIAFAGAFYDKLNVDNIQIDGNVISTTNTNGDIILNPNGTGGVQMFDQTVDTVVIIDGNQRLSSSPSVSTTELNLLDGLTGTILTGTNSVSLSNKTINADNNTITNIDDDDIRAAAGIAFSKMADLTNNRALVSNGTGDVSVATTTATEIGYVNGVTSAIQTQINGKQSLSTLTTKGDLYVATGSATVTRLPVGSNTFVLTADSAEASGMKWAAQGSGPSLGRYCTISWGQASNAFWVTTSSTFALPAADTDYPTPTVTTSTIATAAGVTCSAPGTKVAQLVTSSLPAGEYKLSAVLPVSCDPSVRGYGRITDGTTTGVANMFATNGTTPNQTIYPHVQVVYATTQSPTFSYQQASNAGGSCTVNNGYDSGKSEVVFYLDRIR